MLLLKHWLTYNDNIMLAHTYIKARSNLTVFPTFFPLSTRFLHFLHKNDWTSTLHADMGENLKDWLQN